MTEADVVFEAGRGRAGGALTRPDSLRPRPAIVLLPAIAGVNDYILRVGRRLAAAGFVSLALDYFDGAGPPPLGTPEEVLAAVADLPDERVVDDATSAARFLADQPFVRADRIALMGFCVGGSMTLLTASRAEQPFCGAVVYYGVLRYAATTAAKPRSPLDAALDVTCPLVGHFGEADRLVPLDDVAELRDRLVGKPAEILTYPGAGHAFHEDFRPEAYRPVASTVAWTRTMAFLNWHLQ